MADISQQINAINSARYGEEVRGSIVTALTAVNNQVEDDTTSAGASATAAAASATEAAATEARLASAVAAAEQTEEDIEAAEALRVTAEQGRVDAEDARVTAEAARADAATNYVAQAQAAAAQAQQYASSDYVRTAQSWAIGGTSSRYGEDTNNAKYWAEIAAEVVTEGGVGSFNGRMGQVSPEAGDYDTAMITRGTGSAESALAAIENGIGTTTLPTTDQTLTGAIAEHETDITALNGKNYANVTAAQTVLAYISPLSNGSYFVYSSALTGGPAGSCYYRIYKHSTYAYVVATRASSDKLTYDAYITPNTTAIAWTKIPTRAEIDTLNGKTSGSGTASNDYGSCSYSWARRANIATVRVEYTPNQAISGSSGSLALTNIPEPSLDGIISATYDTNSSTTVCGPAELSTSKNCGFYGPRTSGHVYKASFTYIIN